VRQLLFERKALWTSLLSKEPGPSWERSFEVSKMTAASKKSRSISAIAVQPFSAKGFGGPRNQKLEDSGF